MHYNMLTSWLRDQALCKNIPPLLYIQLDTFPANTNGNQHNGYGQMLHCVKAEV